MAKPVRLFPRPCGSLRSRAIEVKDGNYGLITGYGLDEGVCLRVSLVHVDECNCVHQEQPYCLGGKQIGLDCESTQAVLPMPGCYVIDICLEECAELADDFEVFIDVGGDLQHLQVIYAACAGQPVCCTKKGH